MKRSFYSLLLYERNTYVYRLNEVSADSRSVTNTKFKCGDVDTSKRVLAGCAQRAWSDHTFISMGKREVSRKLIASNQFRCKILLLCALEQT